MNASNRTRSFSIAITGSGGSGAVTTGRILLEAAALAGLQGVMMRSAGPQIRGGESAAMVRFSPSAVDCMGDRFDLLLALDWRNAERFADEIPLTEQSLILADPAVGEVPLQLRGNGAQFQPVAFKQLAASLEGGRINMVALGAAGRVVGLSLASLQQALNRILGPKGGAGGGGSAGGSRIRLCSAVAGAFFTAFRRASRRALEPQRQPGLCAGSAAWWGALCRSLPDHPGQRDAGVAGATAGTAWRLAAAGGG
ncbi:2-oxoacid:acceptor oxidoreductase family protein [endosymbiont of Tevnia jerichonana]|uniref:2-oxoacid:acceptor oxidoreductase family protein n=1 Tax=endosymbiont of Tevnia jerichonana TaxID=94785 RepID=UPI0030B82CE5